MMRFLIGSLLAAAAVVGAFLLEGGEPLSLLGLSSFLITFFVPFFGCLAIWPWGVWRRSWVHAFRAGEVKEAAVSVRLWRFSEHASYLAGLLGTLVGGILIFGNWTAVPADRVAHSFAALLLSPIYGTGFGLGARLLRARVLSLNPGVPRP